MIPKNANAMQIVVNIIANITEIVAKAWQIQLLLFCNFPEVFKIFLVHSWLNPQTWDPQIWRANCIFQRPSHGRAGIFTQVVRVVHHCQMIPDRSFQKHIFKKNKQTRDFLGNPVVKIPHFHCTNLIPGQETKIQCAAQCGQKNNRTGATGLQLVIL